MHKTVLYNQIIKKIDLFNEIFILDVTKNRNYKNWSDYVNPVSRYLFKQDYVDFVLNNPVTQVCMVGTLEKYYNIFVYLVRDLRSVTTVAAASEIYTCAVDVIKAFDQFISTNDFVISSVTVLEDGQERIKYNLYPML